MGRETAEVPHGKEEKEVIIYLERIILDYWWALGNSPRVTEIKRRKRS
jgi:hypothetical protein